MTPQVIETFIKGAVASEIAKLLNGGNLSPMLQNCEGRMICSTTQIVECAELADLIVKHLVEDGVMGPLVSAVEKTDTGYVVKFATGQEDVELLDNVVTGMSIEDSVLTLTLADESTLTLDLAGEVAISVGDEFTGTGTEDDPLGLLNPLPVAEADQEGAHLVQGPEGPVWAHIHIDGTLQGTGTEVDPYRVTNPLPASTDDNAGAHLVVDGSGNPVWEQPEPCYVPIREEASNHILTIEDHGQLFMFGSTTDSHLVIADDVEYPVGFRVDIRGVAKVDTTGSNVLNSIDDLTWVVEDGGASLVHLGNGQWWLAGALSDTGPQ